MTNGRPTIDRLDEIFLRWPETVTGAGEGAQSGKDFDLSGYVRFWLNNGPKVTGNLRVQVDIDPQSFL